MLLSLLGIMPTGERCGVDLSLINSNDIICVEETAITVRSYRRRTTVPSKIYKLLEIGPGDSLRWVALKDGTVYLTKIKQNNEINVPETE